MRRPGPHVAVAGRALAILGGHAPLLAAPQKLQISSHCTRFATMFTDETVMVILAVRPDDRAAGSAPCPWRHPVMRQVARIELPSDEGAENGGLCIGGYRSHDCKYAKAVSQSQGL